ncbi:MAG: cbb3-type cytochrome c oxidase subunit I [Actinobacteria bacterium]|nr:cbb3-type cytochrome c oxidase subunit I [Actinomycetota bacterium]
MADTKTADIRAVLGGGTPEDRLAAVHILVGAVFLLIGSVAAVLSFFALRFPDLIPVSYGRLEPIANLTLVIGFGVVSLVGGIYYALPRLTGTRLWNARLAGLGLLGTTGLVTLGVLAVALGLGSGRQPFGLPWWLDIPMLGVLAVPFMVTGRTIAERQERRSYVTVWFMLGGVTWLPLLYAAHVAGHLPSLGVLAVAYNDLFLSSGLQTMVILTLGSGLFYYTVVRELDVPLASRQLAMVGFWSLGFASVWWGTAQLIFGPGPDWVSGVAAALGLALPVGALANAANVSLTLEGSWDETSTHPGVAAGVTGTYLAVGVGAIAAFAGFRSVAAVTALTGFWEGVEYALIAGVGALLVAGTTLPSLPRLLGREIVSRQRARTFTRLTLAGSVGVLVAMAAHGLLSGYSWIGGANTGEFVSVGEGWGTGVGAGGDTLLLLALISAVVALMGHLSDASTVFGTLVRGRAVPQEVLVSMGVEDE